MATEQPTPAFGRVSRSKDIVFRGIASGASVIGIIALSMLLVYVAIDAFDLTNASIAWLSTYLLVLVLPFIVFCLSSAHDRVVTRRTAIALLGGLILCAAIVTGIERYIHPIPRLGWPLVYVFVVVVPVVGYVTFAASEGAVGRVGIGAVGRLVGGTALGLALIVLFTVLDYRLWFLVYTLGVLPASLLTGYARFRPDSRAGSIAVPVGLLGIVVAVVLRELLRVYPITFLVYAWAVAVPLAAVGAWVIASRRGWRTAVTVSGVSLALAVGGGLAAVPVGLPPEASLLILSGVAPATVVFLDHVREEGMGRIGLGLPILLIVGALVGGAIVETFGFPGPDPWLDLEYVTSVPSRNAVDAGLYPAIVGSVIIIAMVAVASFVVGVGSAVFLEEYTAGTGLGGTITRLIHINIANLAAVPSVVYGLLGLGLFANFLGLGFGTAVTAALTLSLLILPITIISAQEAIRGVPDDLRRGSYAMGATRWQTVKHVVLPQAMPGILTGTILALGRAIGETAPLIMIGAATTVFNPPNSVWSKVSAMPMQIFAWADFPQEEFRYGVLAAGVVTLLIVLLGMNATAIILRMRYERSN